MSKEELHKNIEIRVDKMIEAGLIKEVKQFKSSWPSQRAIGYKEVHEYLEGKITKEQMIENIKKNTKYLAKKQATWIRNQLSQ